MIFGGGDPWKLLLLLVGAAVVIFGPILGIIGLVIAMYRRRKSEVPLDQQKLFYLSVFSIMASFFAFILLSAI